ncbi:transporter substrate-binding domain-containing protein [Deinococcus arenicola]|uniref:Transporter substrate-binding domain-containing protein n=1 Tax=Deinococcus arenicola TaxID=2994950 RepID=A0ABU4DP84_9DEIO|nr:transporter substrate-binding domain-containing protein [Deinococcus sp. ZS9-10]MDV6374243.1 transporter substrate-binding domain-containing protein [Deinococcus sp. ZS9-10]
MKHLFLMSALVLASSSLAATAPAATMPSTLTQGTLKIGMEGTYPPFTYKDAKGNLTGFDVDISRAIAAKLNLKPEFVLTEWSGIIAGLQAGKYDVIVNQVAITPERQKSIGFSEPYVYSTPQIIVKKSGNFAPKTLADLKGKRVGSSLGSNYEAQLKATGGINILTYPGAAEVLADLATGRIDAGYNDRLLVSYLIKSQNLPIRGAGTGNADAMGIALKKTNTGLKTAIDKALLQIKADGTYAKISRQWFGQDVSKP